MLKTVNVKKKFFSHKKISVLLPRDLFPLYRYLSYVQKFITTLSKFENDILKICRGGSRSLEYAEFGHLSLLLCRERQRNVPRIKTQVHSHCTATGQAPTTLIRFRLRTHTF